MAALSETHKLLVVTRLACFYTPTEVQKELKESSVDASLQQIQFYDPTTINGAKQLSQQWKDIFKEVRQQFIADNSSIAISHQSYRLRQLQRITETNRSPVIVMNALEQAAKEMGGLFTNRRELSGPDGGAIPLDIGAAIDRVYGDAEDPGESADKPD